jgi:hypothetical protein
MAKKPTKQQHTWEITRIRERRRLLGHVEAPDEKTAIDEAIRRFGSRTLSSKSAWLSSARRRWPDLAASSRDFSRHNVV